LLHELFNERRVPNIPMFIDSPLAVDVTKVFREHPECYDERRANT
jgi:metallo-beta-lactamase family protein